MSDVFKLVGADSVKRRVVELQTQFPEAAAAALYVEGFGVMAVSQPRVPVDTGRLRATGYVTPPVDHPDGMFLEIGYATDYAIYVHEILENQHTVGEAKFLERALNERLVGWMERMGKRIMENVQQGIGVSAVPPDPGIASSPEEGAARGGRHGGG